ncbi:MAG: hypothetical protein MZV64_59240 [Ignavibacteriales bacterium]|nr:hypothetical protein [Ignavibacteriales bacterium]
MVTGSALLAACAPSVTESTVPEADAPVVASGLDRRVGRSCQFVRRHHQLQQLLRIHHRQGRRCQAGAESFKPRPWTVEVYGLVNKPKTFGMEDLLEQVHAGGTHLPPALCGSLEHGHPVDGFHAGEPAEGSGANLGCEICPL